MGREVRIYTTPRCHLCEQAKQALAASGIAFDEVDASDDPDRFLRTPVVEVAGVEVSEGPLDLPAVRKAARSRRFPWSGRRRV